MGILVIGYQGGIFSFEYLLCITNTFSCKCKKVTTQIECWLLEWCGPTSECSKCKKVIILEYSEDPLLNVISVKIRHT